MGAREGGAMVSGRWGPGRVVPRHLEGGRPGMLPSSTHNAQGSRLQQKITQRNVSSAKVGEAWYRGETDLNQIVLLLNWYLLSFSHIYFTNALTSRRVFKNGSRGTHGPG